MPLISNLITTTVRSCSTKQNSFYDVVIVGAGLVGSAMACSLGKNPWLEQKRILLIDSGRVKVNVPMKDGIYHNRVSAVRPTSINFFKRLGAWDHIESRAKPVATLFVEDGCTGSKISFHQSDKYLPIVCIIENDLIIRALNIILKNNCSNLELKEECSFESLSISESLAENVFLKLNNGQEIECSLLIACDGAQSKIREIAGIKHTVQNYNQTAIVATLRIKSEDQENSIAWQRFMPLGPIALLPLNENLSSLVWTTSTEEARTLLELPKELFLNELNRKLCDTTTYNQNIKGSIDTLNSLFNFLPIYNPSTKMNFPTVLSFANDNDDRAAFPISFIYANDYIGHRVALVGDAAHRVHPLAGQGVNLGWSDVINLTKALELAVKEGGDLGSITYLKYYDIESQRKNTRIMAAIDLFNHLFSTDFGPSVLIRSIGFSFLDGLLPAKDVIVRMAS